MAKKGSKKAKHDKTPQDSKTAKHEKQPEGYQGMLIAWHLQHMDKGGAWSCTINDLETIKKRLHEFEKMKWREALQPLSNHPIPINKICEAARRRLSELNYGDTHLLYQLEIKGSRGKQRLWGIRRENVFQILWWDPQHTVYPVYKKNT